MKLEDDKIIEMLEGLIDVNRLQEQWNKELRSSVEDLSVVVRLLENRVHRLENKTKEAQP